MPVIPGKSATYDYVVIGGGTAGLTIATRLAQDSSLSVAIVEAVGFYEVDGGNVSVVPFYGSQGTSNPLLNWQFMTTPQPSLLNQTYHYARGKTLGGSSALNFMIYQRATVDSLQKWADEIDDQSYTSYQKSTNYTYAKVDLRIRNATVANDTGAFVAGAGPLHVSYPNYANPLGTFYPAAFEELGLSPLPYGVNTGPLIGYAYSTVTENPEDETRSSSQSSFLDFAITHTNLTIYTKTIVEKILFDNLNLARGVNIKTDNTSFTLFAQKEIILSAGAIQSPQLLMVSGIGPAKILQQYNIPIIADLPGVGQNLHDNPASIVLYNSPFVLDAAQLATAVVPYEVNHTGPYTNPGSEVIGWDKVSTKKFSNLSLSTIASLAESFPPDWPEVEFVANGVDSLVMSYGRHSPAQPIGTVFSILTTFSRGNVTISSDSMDNPPLINPGWYSDPRDREIGIASFRYIRALEATESLKELLVDGELVPGDSVQTDEEIWEYIQKGTTSLSHASCTNKMGKSDDKMAVVDSDAKVYGIKNLRVVDASSFPFLVPGQPQSMVYALAEKIADRILNP
ncbi:glucose-methanol-choline oxidoreductase [Mollisia scopiformis]|uniref:Glucose-methanol-choline oxidoreductase n=1 Tax=Mollisia scopiformis TaxID=149040 RepID=A0A194XBL7_MOLSC|nr:glucose-methanol-choline oxidoreductase [Mollisia scopiformis]KUJ17548.1 glucose-methanol-choline oxidoreductase [Mollisia scopiformis]